MKLTSLTFKNYKAFSASETLEMRALTVLIGANSSGKSAIARLPLLIQRGLSPQTNAPIDLTFDNLDFGSSFIDLTHGRSPHRAIELGASFQMTDKKTIAFKTKIHYFDKPRLQVVSNFHFKSQSDECTLNWELDDPLPEEKSYTLNKGEKCTAVFQGLFPKKISVAKFDYLPRLRNEISQFLNEKIVYLGPFRESPKRFYHFPSGRPQTVGFKGEQVPALLGDDKLRSSGELIDNVSDWFQRYLGGWRLNVNQQNDIFSLSMEHPTEDLQVNLADVGAGIGQVLPIVAQCYTNQTGSLQIVEQPELHLHPAAHGDVADLYIDSFKKTNSQLLIETHSENFILRIRRRIAEGKLNPDDVIIYWVDDQAPAGEKRLKPIYIDEKGDVDHWPSGVFSEDFQEVSAIRKAQRQGKGE